MSLYSWLSTLIVETFRLGEIWQRWTGLCCRVGRLNFNLLHHLHAWSLQVLLSLWRVTLACWLWTLHTMATCSSGSSPPRSPRRPPPWSSGSRDRADNEPSRSFRFHNISERAPTRRTLFLLKAEHIKTVRCLQAKSDLCLSANTSYEPNNYCSSSAVCKRRLQCLQH